MLGEEAKAPESPGELDPWAARILTAQTLDELFANG